MALLNDSLMCAHFLAACPRNITRLTNTEDTDQKSLTVYNMLLENHLVPLLQKPNHLIVCKKLIMTSVHKDYARIR